MSDVDLDKYLSDKYPDAFDSVDFGADDEAEEAAKPMPTQLSKAEMDERKKTVAALRETGMSPAEIAKKLGVTVQAITRLGPNKVNRTNGAAQKPWRPSPPKPAVRKLEERQPEPIAQTKAVAVIPNGNGKAAIRVQVFTIDVEADQETVNTVTKNLGAFLEQALQK
jgi:transposase